MSIKQSEGSPEVFIIALLVLSGHPELDGDEGAGAGEALRREQLVRASVRLQRALASKMRDHDILTLHFAFTDLRLLVLPSVPASPLPDLLMMTVIPGEGY